MLYMDDQQKKGLSKDQDNSTNVSLPNKEVEPAPVTEYVKPSESEITIDKELEETGIKKTEETPKLTKEHKDLGIEHTEQIETQQKNVKLPITEEEAEQIEKKEKPSSSIKWLALLVIKAFKKIKGGEK